ncbi:MAG: hypothetical protein E3J35_02360 [Methanomassiliicoccales archaeon]|nr:MAG: hypothetical protein E3J35_02360 [Methanomassiliicoccales archaeon]
MAKRKRGTKKRDKPQLKDLAIAEKGAKDFFKSKEGVVTESSMSAYTMHLGVAIKYSHERFNKSLLDLTEDEATELARVLSVEKRSATTSGILVRMFYNYHKQYELARAFRIKKNNKQRMDPSEILTGNDVNRLIKAMNTLRDRAITAVLWETGARIHEVLSLDMGNVHLVENDKETHYKVYFGKVKETGQEHSCLLIEASSHLEAWLNAYSMSFVSDAPLFPAYDKIGKKGRLSYGGYRDALRKAVKKARLKKKIYAHLFRHSRATHLLRSGWSPEIVCKYMGWAPGSPMVGRYSHLADQDVDNAVYEMHNKTPPKPREIETIMKAVTDEVGKETPIPKGVESFLNHPGMVRYLDDLIRARVEEQYEQGLRRFGVAFPAMKLDKKK